MLPVEANREPMSRIDLPQGTLDLLILRQFNPWQPCHGDRFTVLIGRFSGANIADRDEYPPCEVFPAVLEKQTLQEKLKARGSMHNGVWDSVCRFRTAYTPCFSLARAFLTFSDSAFESFVSGMAFKTSRAWLDTSTKRFGRSSLLGV